VQAIRVWEKVDHDQFHREIIPLNQPAHIKSVVGHWPAVKAGIESSQAIVDYLKKYDNEKVISALVGDPSIKGRFFYQPGLQALNFQKAQVTLGIGLDRLLTIQHDPNPHAIALQAIPVDLVMPQFDQQNSQPLLDKSIGPTMWLGNRATVAPHYDVHDNLACVVAGQRKFTLFPPEQINNLYPGPMLVTPGGVPVSMVDTEQPDLGRYPNYAEAEKAGQQAVLEPGDGIYIPALWWHGVQSLQAINVLINYWWGGITETEFSPNDSLMHSMMSIANLSPEKREAWRHFFDYYVFKTEAEPAQQLPADLNDLVTSLTPEQQTQVRQFLMAQLR
jgi:mannose-6-phosphate isomerase-like protein (cupin superfamily)